MHWNNHQNVPERTDTNYVVYFYESGLSQQYQQRQRNLTAKLNYDSPVLFPVDYWPVQQTVDDVICKGYLGIPQSEPETAVISDKKHVSRLGLNDVIDQIHERYRIYQKNIHEIEVSKCSAINSFYLHEAYHGPVYKNSKVEYALNKRLDRLYMEQREHRMDLWRDISKLRQQLPEWARQYLSAHRKASMLEDQEGDLN